MQKLKTTRTRCPECQKECVGEVWQLDGSPAAIVMRRQCAEHGVIETKLSSDARFYWLSSGKEENASCGIGCACSPDPLGFSGTLGKNAALAEKAEAPLAVEQLSTCLALIEIVDSCNLSCPTCFAESPAGVGEKLKYKSLKDIQYRIDAVTARKGPIELLQLSGGEPTLHPQFFELLDWLHEHPKIDYTLVNTNGVLLARDEAFAEEFAKRACRPGFQFYLQFDGLEEVGQRILRGADLRELKQKAMARCEEMGLAVTLAMTVIPETLNELWQVVEFGLNYECCRGVSFQPMFESGRKAEGARERLNAADIVLACLSQANGKLKAEDFTPLPCGDPNCAIIGYLLRFGGETHSISDFVDFKSMQGFLRDKVRYELADLEQCGCESEPLGELLKQFELSEKNTFRLFIKPFMDAGTWDEDRIDRCCTHVIRPDGKLDSFCRYYSGFTDHQGWKFQI